MDRPPWPPSRPTFQPARRRSLLVRWLVAMLIIAAAAFAAWSLISIDSDRFPEVAEDFAWHYSW